MVATTARVDRVRYAKWILFAAMGIATIVAVATADRFLIDPHDPEWAHIAPFRWFLLMHALAGVTALLTGPLQFSSRIRRTHLALHRTLGRIYVCAALIGSALGMYIGVWHESFPLNVQQPAQAGMWFLSTLLAYVAIRNGHVALHRLWTARSYAFTFIFVASRLPFWSTFNGAQFTQVLWYLVLAAIVVPELMISLPQILRSRARA